MKTKNNNESNNIMKFSIKAEDYLRMAKERLEKSDSDTAITFSNNAFELAENKKDSLMLLTQSYFQKEDYDLTLETACELLALYDLNIKEKRTLAEMIACSLINTKRPLAGLYFLALCGFSSTDPHFSPKSLKTIDLAYNDVPNIFDYFEDMCRIKFADEERNEYNVSTYVRVLKLFQEQDYAQALQLVDSMYDNDKDSIGIAELRGRCFVELGRYEEAFSILSEIFKKDHKRGDILFELTRLGEPFRDEVVKLAETLEISDVSFFMERAIYSAYVLELDDLALYLTEKNCEIEENSYKYKMLKAFALWNVGEKKQAKDELFTLLYKMRARYPVEYIKKIRFPKRIPLSANVFPDVLCKRLENLIKKDLADFDEKLQDPDFVDAMVFLLTQDNYCPDNKIIIAISESNSPALIPITKRVCAFPCFVQDNQRWLISRLLMNNVQGETIYFDKRGFFTKIDLVLPESFDKYDNDLKEEYAQAFSLLCELDSYCFEKLCNVFEVIHSDKTLRVCSDSIPLSYVVTYAIFSIYASDLRDDFCNYHQIDIPAIKEYAKVIWEILGEDGDDDEEDFDEDNEF